MKNKVEIRKIKKSEYSSARELVSLIMHSEFKEDVSQFPLNDLDDISLTYGKIGESFFVGVDENGNIIATVGIKREDERTALLRRIFVAREFRRRKVGSLLIDRAIAFCKEVGYQEIIFKTTSRMQGAIALCLRKDFVEKARISLGEVDILKFAYFLKENSPLSD